MADVALVEPSCTTGLVGRSAELLARLAAALHGLAAPGPVGELEHFLRDLAHSDGGAADASGPVLDRLAATLDLAGWELDLLVLATLPEHHEGLPPLLRSVHPVGEPWCSAGLAARLLCDDGWSERPTRLALRHAIVDGPLVRHGLVDVVGPGPLWERSLRPADGLYGALRTPEAGDLPRMDDEVVDHLRPWLEQPDVEAARRVIAARRPWTVVVTAESMTVATHRAAALVADAGRVGHHAARPEPGTAAERQVAAVALVRDAIPVLALEDPSPASSGAEAPPAPGPRTPPLSDHPGPVVLCATGATALPAGDRPTVVVRVEPAGLAEHEAMWASVLPECGSAASVLAARLPVDPVVATAAVRDARALAALGGGTVEPRAVDAHVRARVGATLPVGVHLLRPRAGWSDLVLPEDKRTQLRAAIVRVEHQATVLGEWGFLSGRPGARGVRLLFAGPSGTGKTLSAEVLAHELSVELLLVDLSRIVSKWIGETEKHLEAVFEAAEATRAVLFFDEADALFGERTEVRDASDRYANLETAFLLSRLERFHGFAVLATNLRNHIDRAFSRRLEAVIEFGEPDEAQRRELWRCHLPDTAPRAPDVDLGVLAHLYEVVGGVIRNAAVAAAFAAAAEGGPIHQRHLIDAIQDEYRKAGRPFPGAPLDVR